MRATPLETLRRLGPAETLCALALVPGTVVSGLIYPFLTAQAVLALAADGLLPRAGILPSLAAGGAVIVLVAGFAAMLLPGVVGCRRRGWNDLLPWTLLLPVYFGLVSLAAWLAVIELARDPHRWNKTDHVRSRTSRSGALHLRRRWFAQRKR